MLIPLLRSGVLYMIWRRHIKQRALGIIATVLFVLAVNLIHSEALAFFSATNKSTLAPFAFYFRWLAWLAAGLSYLWFVERKIAKTAKAQRNASSKKTQPQSKPEAKPIEQHDGFDSLRHNTPLRSRADIMLERKKRDKPD
ncbi:hypothetical protein [uncultured Zhongshania sp.]|uniref:hypothetical protein n=1 Tax=uncultured Zhongshania sp. TaxID=1642288 RepID=UPI0025E070DF|nr:hypothetical protein [uncultured Zhongshania sp.]|tara:strand:+ start:1883 stop:2305 length:423 start_codon:yes stop_codon:yes gene_type:complete